MAKTKEPKIVVTFVLDPKIIKDTLVGHCKPVIVKNHQEFRREIVDADGVICLLTDSMNARTLGKAKKIRVIGNVAVGINNIDLRYCQSRDIRVVNTPNVLTRATAELTIALLFAVARRITEGDRLCRKGAFKGWQMDLLPGLELRGRHAVLVGQGRIGQETAHMLKAIGISVSWITRADSNSEILNKLKRAQILSLHIPLTKQTQHWLNATRIRALPPDSIVLNTSRGPTIDENALATTLQKGRIFGAGLDVYEREPKIDSRLRATPRTVLLPHLGSATLETREGMARLACQGVVGVLNGKTPPNQVKLIP